MLYLKPTHQRLSATRMAPITLGFVGLTVTAVFASFAIGARSIPISEVVAALLGTSTSPEAVVVTSQRIPRTLVALIAGSGLGAAGALMQGHTRNPLADPGLFGVNAGAGFLVALTAFTIGISSPFTITLAALFGAAITAVFIFFLGLRHVNSSALVMLAVIGTTVSALLSGLTTAIILLDKQALDVVRFWVAGSVTNRDTSQIILTLILTIIGMLLAVSNGFSINNLSLGEDVAKSLGTRVLQSRIVGILAITLLAGAATALCGPIGFVGLVAPHLARVFSRHDYRWLIVQSALAGGSLLLFADILGRVMAPPGELQAGIVMGIVGAPILILIARKRRLVAL